MMTDTTRDRVNLFLCSFTILFIELALIRWIPAYVRALGFFTNFVLLGSFLGIGLGILLARRRFDLLTLFPVALAVLVGVISYFKFELVVYSTQEIFFGIAGRGQEPFYLLPLVFAVVTVLFTLLGQSLGRLLTAVRPPLTAYTIDVAGSVAGSALFALVSFLGAQPAIWFAIGALGVLALPQRRFARVASAIVLLGVVVWTGSLGSQSLWSPYYRVDVRPLKHHGYSIFVNNIGHQGVAPYQYRIKGALFYLQPFQTFHFPTTARELIIGAGTGTDADVAVHNGMRHVTGVELDPIIHRLGEQLQPDRIYQNPAVHIVVDDGRSFLEKTGGTYDLIVFALPDSLALTSSFANLRLESYLFTDESFAAARRHLSPNGVLVLYNYYRQPWLINKLAGMLTHAFGGQVPIGRTWLSQGAAAVLMDGPRLRSLTPARMAALRLRTVSGAAGVDDATDDWPFLYLKTHSLSLVYLQALGLVWLFALAAIGITLLGRRDAGWRRFDVPLFFQGLAFLLLESKSIVNFSLLFGSTWLVNALVTIGILLTVLLANWINAASRLRLDLRLLYLGLAIALAVNLLLPLHVLLVDNLALRYALGCAVLFSPILLANLIFGRLFGDAATPDIAFAANLIGAFVGGTFEYLSLQIGYHLLLLPVIAAYLLSFVAVALRRGRPLTARAPVAAR